MSTKLLKMIILFLLISATIEQDECIDRRCGQNGPAIRFPFRIEGIQPQRCGYSTSFDVSCSKDNQTLLRLPNSANFFVKNINYTLQTIHLAYPADCPPKQIRNFNSSATPFQYTADSYRQNYTIFHCESEPSYGYLAFPSCPNVYGQTLYAVPSDYFITEVISCTKLYELVSVPYEILNRSELVLSWSEFSQCKAEGERYRLKYSNTTTRPIIECYGAEKPDTKRKLAISASVICPFFLAVIAFALCSVYRKNKTEEENQVKIKKFLANYESFMPIRYSYVDIKKITNQFSDELGQGAYGTVYKGKLSDELHVAVKVLNNSKGKGEEFINEVRIISEIHHVNVVRLVGFCADGFRRALVYEFLTNGSLHKFISPTTNERIHLGWEKMKDIALGVAKGIEYLHQGCDQRILHFDIKPHNVLLDQNFNPKVSDFGTAKLCSKDQSVVSMTTARGTMGYIAPEVFSRNFGDVSYKSDVYSFGMLLLEMVGSRRKVMDVSLVKSGSREFYLPEWIYKRLEKGENLEIDIDEEEDIETAKKLAMVGLWCIQWKPMNRPSMSVVVKMIEGKEGLDIPPNPFSKGIAAKKNYSNVTNLPGRYVQQELSVISELE